MGIRNSRNAISSGIATGVSAKKTVRFATDAPLDANTYDNGANNDGVGATIIIDANGVLADIDGVTPVLQDRVLVKDEVAGLKNGFYIVTTLGDGSTQAVLTRATDADENAEVGANTNVFISEGTANADTLITLTNDGAITIGTTALVFDFAVPSTTDDLPEGSSNLYFTNSRADARIAAAVDVTVQAQGDVLDDLNTLGAAASDGQFLVATGAGAFTYESGATVRTSLGLGTTDAPTFQGLSLSETLAGSGSVKNMADAQLIFSSGTQSVEANAIVASFTLTGAAISSGTLENSLSGITGGFIHGSTGTVAEASGVAGVFSTTTATPIGTVTTGIGVAGVVIHATTGTITTASALRGVVQNLSTGIITNAIGVDIQDIVNSGGGTVTNAYGIKIDDITGGINDWAIKTGTGLVEFGDNVVAPAIKLTTGASNTFVLTSDADGNASWVAAPGGAGSLAATLVIGSITGGNNIITSNGDVIRGVTKGELNLRNGSDGAILLASDLAGSYGESGLDIASDFVAIFTQAFDGFLDITSGVKLNSSWVINAANADTIAIQASNLVGGDQFNAFNNEIQDLTSNASGDVNGSAVSARNATLKSGVTNSVALGGVGSIVKTDDTAYVQQLGFTETAVIEGLMSSATLTASRTWTLPDSTGTIALQTGVNFGPSAVTSITVVNGIITSIS